MFRLFMDKNHIVALGLAQFLIGYLLLNSRDIDQIQIYREGKRHFWVAWCKIHYFIWRQLKQV